MQQNECKLRAIISPFDGGLQAQLLELDIAVQGATVEEILGEFSHAITTYYEAARDLDEAPFADLDIAPQQYQGRWREGMSSQKGNIELSEEVALALSTALRTRKRIREVVFEECAMCA